MASEFPFPPADNRDWCRGLLEEKKIWAYNNGEYLPLLFQLDEYEVENLGEVTEGCKVDWTYKTYDGTGNVVGAYYTISSGSIFLKNSTITEYDSAITNKKTIQHEYSARSLLPIKTKQNNSNGTISYTFATYPYDYDSGTVFIDTLRSKNIVNTPIEIVSGSEDEEGRFIITQGVISTYDIASPGDIDEQFHLESPQQIPKADFEFSSRTTGVLPPDGTDTLFLKDSRYILRQSIDLYENGRILQYTGNNEDTTSIIG